MKMKTITTIAASMMLMATTASAVTYYDASNNVFTGPATTDWVGTEDDSVLPDMCKFTANTDGTMKLSGLNSQDWETSSANAAKVTLEFRGITNKIMVEADDSAINQVGSGTGNGAIVEQGSGSFLGTFDADVTYDNSTMVVTYDGTSATKSATVNAGDQSFQVVLDSTSTGSNSAVTSYTAGVAEIEIAGFAKPTGNAIYDANTEYRVTHKVTCVQ